MSQLTSLEKAQKINLDEQRYGSFSEIGAGQEVVRYFFQASGSAGTVAKSLSAYDMEVSDILYGDCESYVCRHRLEQMLDRESLLTVQTLGEKEGSKKAFFSYANTVSARNYKGSNRCHGWMGIDFQDPPEEKFNRIVVHFNLYDKTNLSQQDIVGRLGTNLTYAAFYYSSDIKVFLKMLFDGLNKERVEIDAVDFSGPLFEKIDNRLVSLYLVKIGLSSSAMFNYEGKVLLPLEEFYKKNLIVERGGFFPLTNLHLDIMQCGIEKFRQIYNNKDVFPFMAMSMSNLFLSNDEEHDLSLFLTRADLLCKAGANVLITDYPEYHHLAYYLLKNTTGVISICVGANVIENIFNEKRYTELGGGLLEALGRMFKKNIKFFVYPYKDIKTGEFVTLDNLRIDEKFNEILKYLKKQQSIIYLDNHHKQYLGCSSKYVKTLILKNDDAWEDYVPSILIDSIKVADFNC